ncbi:hypothetical protein BEWA_028340 [Theileria equi strain WA]|uniref:GOLD domain-containing protein n=1 Tax=Theileria equi strain WA TaxID=1537102 RepID=L0AWR3_THEEQ|nr:hypothetical protein BEWA_028340 [Theileria equi strain WA]AFZ79985.1 hypothetical protein BEWA_028340 [Theileria equi strain WA]|eukprot:XP_004829651.1 hypothetical protein BEWA_028340 [Theileria equi strain WA]
MTILPLIFTTCVNALYFNVFYGTERCFFETVPENALLSVSYDLITEEGKDCVIQILDDQKKLLLTHDLSQKNDKKRVSYVSNKTSVYTVCVQCPTHLWYLSQICKISLSIEIANGSNLGNTPQYEPDVESAAKREEIDKLTDDLSHFVASVMAIENHQISENRTSTKLYKSYKRMNRWILLFYVAEIFLICSSAAISVFYVTKFFKRQCIL